MGPQQSHTVRPLGARVGKYRLLAELGTGGMAHVYLAVMRGPHGFNKLVVLKVPRDNVMADPEMLAMFHEEARLAARLNHPNVVQTYEVIHEEDRDITVMEYLDGQPLHGVLMRGRKVAKPLPLAMHLRIIAEALTGLHYVHEAKDFDGTPLELVHRDVSPPNLFVTFEGQVKVLDFGIAKAVTSLHETEIGTFKGKVRYMPPEQLMGQKIDRRADIFAVGAILWDAAVGQRLWKGRTDVEVISAIIANQVPPPRSVNPDVPDALDAIVRKALAHHREARHSTCLELQAEIEAYLETLPKRYSAQDVAAYMIDLFAQIREERQRILETQLMKASSLPTGEYAPLQPADLPIPSLSTLNAVRMPTTPSGSRSLKSAIEQHEPSTASGLTQAPPKRRSSAITWVAIVSALALIGGGLLVGKSLNSGTASANKSESSDVAGAAAKNVAPPPTSQETPAAQAAAGGVNAAPSQGEVVVVLRAEPKDAHLFLDDAPLASNPSIQRAPKSAAVHSIRAEANGYVSKSATVVMSSDGDVLLKLEKEPAPSTWRPSRSRPQAPPPAAQPVAPPLQPTPPAAASPARPADSDPKLETPGKKQPRPIDTNDPWSK